MTPFRRRVVEVLRQLQPGDVVTYGEVAREAGYPGAARAVGRVLRETDDLPWWRVVTATGRLVPGLEEEQSRLLASDAGSVRPASLPSGGSPARPPTPSGRGAGRPR